MATKNPNQSGLSIWPQTIVSLQEEAVARKWKAEHIDRLWAAHELVVRLFSGRFRGSGRPFIDHLTGTAGLAIRHGGELDTVMAGFAHAAYAQGDFGLMRSGLTPRNRAEIRAELGVEAEALIAAYDPFDWSGLAERADPKEALVLSHFERQLFFLHLVNELDDSLDAPVYSDEWCRENCARLASGQTFAEHLGYDTLAAGICSRLVELQQIAPQRERRIRAKRSVTIFPASTRRALTWRIRRRIWKLFRL